ncbi:hypothetical protein N577_011355 [Lacticaseibacillus rhamnosus 2166]|nr:hypothetical protein N577_011355 [Lacticaseibacillus rhamnosus 2166]
MKKIWLTIGGIWLISVIYFLIYINLPAMQLAVNEKRLFYRWFMASWI